MCRSRLCRPASSWHCQPASLPRFIWAFFPTAFCSTLCNPPRHLFGKPSSGHVTRGIFRHLNTSRQRGGDTPTPPRAIEVSQKTNDLASLVHRVPIRELFFRQIPSPQHFFLAV